jgi:hypothetical protein
MPDVSYVPGALTAVVGGWCLALIEASPDSPVVARIWAEIGHGTQADAVLGGLLADGHGGVPGFVMLVLGDDGTPRLFCRGAVGATVYGDALNDAAAGGTSGKIDGLGLLTWREQVVTADVRRIVLGEPPDGAALRLPAASGVLLAGCVIIDLAGPVPSAAGLSEAGLSGAGPREDDAEDIIKTIVLDTGVRHAPPLNPAGQRPMRQEHVVETLSGQGPLVQGDVLKDTVNQNAVLPDTVTDAPATGVAAGVGVVTASPGTGGAGSPNGYPDTITMTTPGSMARDGAAPAAGTPLPPMPAPARPAGAPGPSSPQGPPGALIDVPPWLAAPGAPTPAGGMPAWTPQPPQSQPSQPQSPHSPPSQPRRDDGGPGESGATLQRADLAGLVTAAPDRIGPVLPALVCAAGHVNPPSGAACRRCGAPLPHDPVPVPRPVLGVLRLSLGGVITLDRGVIMGRNPRADFAGPDGEERPHVVRLPSADGDISRNHVRVDLDGWHVLVTDLNSTNGTLVTLPGRDPQQLRPGEPVPIQPNTVVTLADGIYFRYEVTE